MYNDKKLAWTAIESPELDTILESELNLISPPDTLAPRYSIVLLKLPPDKPCTSQ